jgi:hypothetical protein
VDGLIYFGGTSKVMAVNVHVKISGVWVSESGEYGVGNVIVLHQSQVSIGQLEALACMNENDRFDYATAIINGDDTSRWDVK